MAEDTGSQRLERVRCTRGSAHRRHRHCVAPGRDGQLSHAKREWPRLPAGSLSRRRCRSPAAAGSTASDSCLSSSTWGLARGVSPRAHVHPPPRAGTRLQIGSSQMSLVRLKGPIASGWALSSGGLVSLRERMAVGQWGSTSRERGVFLSSEDVVTTRTGRRQDGSPEPSEGHGHADTWVSGFCSQTRQPKWSHGHDFIYKAFNTLF